MKISLSWLKQYVDVDLPVSELSHRLTMAGIEVGEVEIIGGWTEVFVGHVTDVRPHPNADRLTLCKVRIRKADEANEIVCGASNYKVGDRVVVALNGAVLPGGVKIKRSKIRGVVSDGMMCSARELSLGNDHDGILILESCPEIGTPVNEVFPEGDVIFDVEITPNRPDCLSCIG